MLTDEKIYFLNNVCSGNWREINGTICVEGDVNITASILNKTGLTQIPVQFGRVDGDFFCRNINLTTLKGCPSIIRGNFSCLNNGVTTLQHGPKVVGGFYGCANNMLKNLIGAPKICNKSFYCDSNQLISLHGCSRVIKEDLECDNNTNNLCILYGIGYVKGRIYYDNRNELNKWILEHARKKIFLSDADIATQIKNLYSNDKILMNSINIPEIKRYISPYFYKAIALHIC